MQWPEVRKAYPDQWLIIEAMQAHTTDDKKRILDKIAVIECGIDDNDVMTAYRRLHHQYPEREVYFVNTNREELDIRELQWLGVRRGHATNTRR